MTTHGDLIDFDIIETQKENIQSLAGGRSAKTLAQIFSPVAVHCPSSQTRDLNDAIRAEYEKELSTIDESDDPLDIFDRYVRWTLNAYPSAQATPSSQLLPLLERGTKCFLKSEHYKNDPRYLKLWLNYIRFFSDAPRETFTYLARHGVGDKLALYYEEFAAWLETAGRWNQAEEIYRMGLEKEARPAERLLRKFGNFQRRMQQSPQEETEHNSPALPTVRPALATRIDPFASVAAPPSDPQTNVRAANSAPVRRQKMQIFSDDGNEAKQAIGGVSKGWENVGTMAERKKENTITARPWVGEKLNVGNRQNLGIPKMPIFKDESLPQSSMPQIITSSLALRTSANTLVREQQVVNAKTGKLERIFVNLEAVYPNINDAREEYCFEELRAAARGWLSMKWSTQVPIKSVVPIRPKPLSSDTTAILIPLALADDKENVAGYHGEGLIFGYDNAAPMEVREEVMEVARRMRKDEKANRTRKIKVREVKGETQTIRTNLCSPQGPKMRRKKSTEATMTVHTKAATNEIYELFNRPLKSMSQSVENPESEEESDDDDDYTSGGESTGTGHISGTTSDFGDETQGEVTEAKSMHDDDEEDTHDTTRSDLTDNGVTAASVEPQTWDHSEKSQITGHVTEASNESLVDSDEYVNEVVGAYTPPAAQAPAAEAVLLDATIDALALSRRPYRNAAQAAQNRLPFMTPIVEKTESLLGTVSTRQDKDYFNSKTPCPKASRKTPTILEMDDEAWSSPFQAELNEVFQDTLKISQSLLTKRKEVTPMTQFIRPIDKIIMEKTQKCPIINETQCNPMDDNIHKLILGAIQPPLSTFEGFFDHKHENYSRKTEIRKFCKMIANTKTNRGGSDKTASTMMLPPLLTFPGAERQYAIKRELGAGAYAPVYLVEGIDSSVSNELNEIQAPVGKGRSKFPISRCSLEAVKMEEPPSPWEFYIIRMAHRRLGVSRGIESIVQAYEMHLFCDEGYLVEEYRDQGTLLDLVNATVQQNNNGSAMDESMAFYFVIELLRTVEALHAKGIIHADLKADNVLVRMPAVVDEAFPRYRPDGSDGWSKRGITLIDFGRGIDMRVFRQDVQFIADWPTSATDCAEMRELRPWTFQADYHGVAAIAHTLLFGRYIETIAEKGAGAGLGEGKVYKLKEGLKRYWQVDIWTELFALMLNPGRHMEVEEGQKMPCLRGMRTVREKMESWLVTNGEKGVGLKALMRKAESLAGGRKK